MKKAALLLSVFVLGVAGVMNVAIADKPDKVTVCQKTGSDKNPYIELSVSAKAAENGHWYAVGHCPDEGDDDDDDTTGGGGFGGGGAFRSDAASSNPVLAATK